MQRVGPYKHHTCQSLLDLSPQLIEKILLCLDLRERAQSLMVCKKLCEVGEQSALLWQTVAWTPGTAYNMSSMLRWLVAHNSKILRLSLRAQEDLPPPLLLSVWGMMTSAFVVAAATLLSVDLQVQGEVELSGWVSPLTHLRWLSVTAHRIVVAADVGCLRRLTTLQLSTIDAESALEDTLMFREHSLPAQLEVLALEDLFLRLLPSFPPAVAASLTRLQMDANYCEEFVRRGEAPGSVAGLEPLRALSSLQVLELQRSDLTALPAQVASLTGLTHLCMNWGFNTLPPDELLALSRLSRLSVLIMQYCQLTTLTAAVQGLSRLRTLCLAGNPSLELSLEASCLPFLAQLDLDLDVAVENCSSIQSMTQLRQLCLTGYNGHPQPPPLPAAAVALIRALQSLPLLTALYFSNGGHGPLLSSLEALVAFVEFVRRRPGVAVRRACCQVGNPFNGGWPTWQDVQEAAARDG